MTSLLMPATSTGIKSHRLIVARKAAVYKDKVSRALTFNDRVRPGRSYEEL